ERQRRELGIERFRREGLYAEQSDAATLPPGDVLPPTDADTASDEQSDAATLPPGDVLPPTDADTASDEQSDAATLPPGDVLPPTDADTASDEQSDAATLPPGDVLPPTDADTASDEQSDAATLPPGDVLPPTDADTASDEQSDAATLPPVSGPSATHYGTRRGSRPLCRCMKQRTNGGTQHEHELARLWPTNEKVPLPPVDNLCMTYLRPSTSLTNAMGSAVPTSSEAFTTESSHQFILPPVVPVVDRPPLPFLRAPTWWANMREHFHLLHMVLFFFSLFFEPFP
ncbi:hypothetical protein Q4I30_000350, partial [Leishmania utingensis]